MSGICQSLGHEPVVICTPQEFMEGITLCHAIPLLKRYASTAHGENVEELLGLD